VEDFLHVRVQRLESMSVTTQLQPAFPESLPSSGSNLRPPGTRDFPPNASIVLVGSRGSGKRSLGFIGATHLGRRLITEDHFFQEATGISRGDFLRKYGNQDFYRRNVDVLREMLEKNRTGCIIECGMGSLASDAQKAIYEYSKLNPVIYILRESERIRRLLNLEEKDAFRLENGDLSHRTCSNLEYYNLYDSSCDGMSSDDTGSPNVASRLKYAKEDFSAFLDFLTGQRFVRSAYESPFSIAALPPECRSFTYALSIRLSSIPELELEELEAGADAVQLKIDTFLPDFQRTIAKQVATIRRKLGVPIIYYIEENMFEGTQYSLLEREDIYFKVLEYGLRLGAEYIVVDLKYSPDRVSRLVQCSGHSKVIGHYLMHEDNSRGWDDDLRMSQYRRAKSLGCNLVRFVRRTSKEGDNETVRTFLKKIESIPGHLPVIAYNIGECGRSSLIENRIFTPVTHPIMLSTVSLSKMRQFLPTAAEAMEALYKRSVLNPLHFYHLGASVFYSLSPAMHSAAYRACGMSNDFQSLQVLSLQDIHRLCQQSNFGGAAITQPFKVEVLSMVTAISSHAKAIGAANTLLPLRTFPDSKVPSNSTESLLRQANRRNTAGTVCGYYGDNTDFIGILNCLRRNMTPRNVVQPSKTTGLVIGAGGMARAAIYAMIQLGCRKIFLHNRTTENAEKVASHFNSWAAGLSNDGQVVRVLSSKQAPWPSNFKFPTMIISCVPAISVGGQAPANFEMPPQWLGSPTGGVIVDVSSHLLVLEYPLTSVKLSYLPLDTPLLRQIRRLREETKQAWVIVDGLEVLPEQAIAQFELMTGRRAPKRQMRHEVRQNYHKYEKQGWNQG
jgi:shikimate 5-dehydrogenase/shikimate kinase